MALLKSLFKIISKSAFGVDPDYRENYHKAYPDKNVECKICHKKLSWESKLYSSDNAVVIDHIWPIKLVARDQRASTYLNSIHNLQPLCANCNDNKRNMINNLDFQQGISKLLYEIQSVLKSFGLNSIIPTDVERMKY